MLVLILIGLAFMWLVAWLITLVVATLLGVPVTFVTVAFVWLVILFYSSYKERK